MVAEPSRPLLNAVVAATDHATGGTVVNGEPGVSWCADHELNRRSWDTLAAVHGQDAYYDSEALIAGASSLIEEEEAALLTAAGADLTGLRVLHLQCHLGFDAITLARRGAAVTGLDFSEAALAKAQQLARRCGVSVEWICADATAVPAALHARFDLVWATMGILCWISDIGAWMRCAGASLVPGGHLVLMDGFPRKRVGRSGATRVAEPFTGDRRIIDSGWDYATPLRTGPQVQFDYSLADIVSAAQDARLNVVRLQEHRDVSHGLCIPHLQMESDGRYRRRVDGNALPVLCTLIARA